MAQLLMSCLLFVSLWTISASSCSETTRLRKPWHKLSGEEQMLFINGFQRLRREGTLATFVKSHDKNSIPVHNSSQVFYWHSYWVWEMESEIRNFGGEYSCFSMPYWDVTNDGEYWFSQNDSKIADIPIYNSNLGGDGDENDTYCVTQAPWSLDYYDCDSLCVFDDEVEGHCCLKRLHVKGLGALHQRAEFGQFGYDEEYSNFSKYASEIGLMHADIHTFIGGKSYTHFHPTEGSGLDSEPAEDPLFPLFHAFIDYIQMLRVDCYQYDLINLDDLDQYIPWAYEEVGGIQLDYLMDFSVLCEEGTDRFCTNNDVTPRIMYDLSPNSPWNVVYELGDFWHENEELMEMCSDKMNSTWWHDEESLQLRDSNYITLVVSRGVIEGLLSITTRSGYYVQIAVVIVVVGLLIRSLWHKCSEKKEVNEGIMSGVDMAYGTV